LTTVRWDKVGGEVDACHLQRRSFIPVVPLRANCHRPHVLNLATASHISDWIVVAAAAALTLPLTPTLLLTSHRLRDA